MKHYLPNSLIIAAGFALLIGLCGCSYTRINYKGATATNVRLFWQTQAVHVTVTNATDVVTVDIEGSRTDGEQLGTIVGTAIKTASTP